MSDVYYVFARITGADDYIDAYSESTTVTAYYDPNGDDKTDILDILIIKREIAIISNNLSKYDVRFDYNQDKIINDSDLLFVINYVLAN